MRPQGEPSAPPTVGPRAAEESPDLRAPGTPSTSPSTAGGRCAGAAGERRRRLRRSQRYGGDAWSRVSSPSRPPDCSGWSSRSGPSRRHEQHVAVLDPRPPALTARAQRLGKTSRRTRRRGARERRVGCVDGDPKHVRLEEQPIARALDPVRFGGQRVAHVEDLFQVSGCERRRSGSAGGPTRGESPRRGEGAARGIVPLDALGEAQVTWATACSRRTCAARGAPHGPAESMPRSRSAPDDCVSRARTAGRLDVPEQLLEVTEHPGAFEQVGRTTISATSGAVSVVHARARGGSQSVSRGAASVTRSTYAGGKKRWKMRCVLPASLGATKYARTGAAKAKRASRRRAAGETSLRR